MNLQPLNDVMEIDIETESLDNRIDVKTKNDPANIEIDISTNVNPLSADLQILHPNIDITIDSNKKELEFTIGSEKKSKVYVNDVYFNNDVQAAGEYTQIGNINKSIDESVILETKGKTLADFIRMIFTKEIQPKITNPSINITFPQNGMYEVGSKISPTYSTVFNPGSYTYGPSTGVTAESYSIKDSYGNENTTPNGSFPDITVTDKTNYNIISNVKHTEGVNALTNLGNDSGVKIEAGTKSRTSAAVTGYRAFFYGVLDESDGTILTSDIIRSLTNGGNYDSERTFMIKANVVEKPKRFIIAIPNSSMRKGVDKVLLTSGFDIEITSQYVLLDDKINVEGVNGFTSVPYKIYQYQPAKIDVGEIHTITLG